MVMLSTHTNASLNLPLAGPLGHPSAQQHGSRGHLLHQWSGLAASPNLPPLLPGADLPSPHLQAAPDSAPQEHSDGVFLRLMALSKGRVMLSRALRLLFPPPEVERMARRGAPMQAPPIKLLWVLLRHLRLLFCTGAGLGPGPAGEHHQAAAAPVLLCRRLGLGSESRVRPVGCSQCCCGSSLLHRSG